MKHIYSVSQKKTSHLTRVGNFAKYQSNFTILSLLDPAQNLLQYDHCISHHILKSLLAFIKRSAILDEKWPFCIFEPPLWA